MIKSPNGTIGPFQANPTVVDSPILSRRFHAHRRSSFDRADGRHRRRRLGRGTQARRRRPHHRRGAHRSRASSASAASSPARHSWKAASSCCGRSSSANAPTNRLRVTRETAANHLLARAAAAPSNTPSAASTSPCGTSSGKISQPARVAAARRLLSRHASSRMARSSSTSPDKLREKLKQAVARGFKAIKLGWRPFGRRDAKTRRAVGEHGPRHGRAGRRD